ncbi:MAG: prenyltransferase/squalene oxidase repeat-containing protein [Promethearchaeota archaeon]
MKLKIKIIVGLLLICTICALSFSMINDASKPNLEVQVEYPSFEHHAVSPLTSDATVEFLEDILTEKTAEYNATGYFSSYYQPTLQATYQALSTLQSLGRLSQVDEVAVGQYIMSHYLPVNSCFIDDTAYRYLDIDLERIYYPLTSLLEVTCYGILSLNIINQLGSINSEELINFIWSSYNPITSGFIGRPYDADLEPEYLIPTADNTYFALITLDILLSNWTDWTLYQDQTNDLIAYLNSLQAGNGGFYNDLELSFDSIVVFDPNLYSSYYAIKSLEVLGMEQTIDKYNFQAYLEALYDSDKNYFSISQIPKPFNESNIVASAIGFDLSDLMGFTGIDRTQLLSFILDGRSHLGGWISSSTVPYHELIDTFQIVRSLEGVGELNSLSYLEKSEVASFISFCKSEGGYAPLTNDYQGLIQLNSLVSSYDVMNRLSELPIQQLYDWIAGSIKYFDLVDGYGFIGSTGMDISKGYFRSHPLEYATSCNFEIISEVRDYFSLEWMLNGLNVLEMLFKMDDLKGNINLMTIIHGVTKTQYLNPSKTHLFGGFGISVRSTIFSDDIQAKRVVFENSYNAFRSLEILTKKMNAGPVRDLLVDADALITHISRNLVETASDIYLVPFHDSSIEKVLENTYQALYILNALGEPDLNHSKIQHFVETSLDYTNIKNIYYSYKIASLYDLPVQFDIAQSQSLIQSIYSDEWNQFYLTSDKEKIEPSVFGWVFEMARNNDVRIDAMYDDPIMLGDYCYLSVELGNLVLKQFGSYATVKFESEFSGSIVLDALPDGTHEKYLYIPTDPSCFPSASGYISVYEGLNKIATQEIIINTNYELTKSASWTNTSKSLFITINASQVFGTGKTPLLQGNAFIEIYRNDVFFRTVEFTQEDFLTCTIFSLLYTPLNSDSYRIMIFLEDGYASEPIFMGETQLSLTGTPHPPEFNLSEGEFSWALGLIIGFTSIPGTIIYAAKRKQTDTKQMYKHKK